MLHKQLIDESFSRRFIFGGSNSSTIKHKVKPCTDLVRLSGCWLPAGKLSLKCEFVRRRSLVKVVFETSRVLSET